MYTDATSDALTADAQRDRVLGVVHPVHDLAEVETGVAGPQTRHCQRGVPRRPRRTGHRHPALEVLAHLHHSTLGHQHHLVPLPVQTGPLDPQLLWVRGGGGLGGGERGGVGGGGGEVAGQHHLAGERPRHRGVLSRLLDVMCRCWGHTHIHTRRHT